ncbi:MAG: glutamate-5-semialdehyde dehydrogenase [Candidatus Tectomicrobia bacterium]|nr:glutamate-5-semialdehyde dehydrogenase [Candidatus Tectomicrobia bacterium]
MAAIEGMARRAKAASLILASAPTGAKNAALEQMAKAIEGRRGDILAANARDARATAALVAAGKMSQPLLDRLTLSEAKVLGMAEQVRSVAALPDPVGRAQYAMELDAGLELFRVTCPIGVIGAIFESRPDALPQIASLCLKAGNAVILKGGTEAQHSNRLLAELLAAAAGGVPGIPTESIQLVESRADVQAMLALDDCIDLMVPRGGKEFVRYIQENTRIPVLGHADGICHAYVDAEADLAMALDIVFDSKTQYPAACNAIETLLVHAAIAPRFLPAAARRLGGAGVELRGCERTVALVPSCTPATEADWRSEYLDLILAVRVVASAAEAIDHINTYGSRHTDTIVTSNEETAHQFLKNVDSSSVMWNASTRFADGFRYGLGAEIGISTNKTHARGPVGLEGLVITKYLLLGSGQCVATYSGATARPFTHRPLAGEPRGL